jgi:malate dehydrogenase (oxaloacetate-decarboxylating)(NADP+)
VGKLALYTACAGVPPQRCLPVTLDVGTNRASLRDDPLYLGLHRPRESGPAYDALVEEFVEAARASFPGVLIQFEDFANHNAFRLLATYRDRACCFNDDIQGTAAVVFAGLLSAMRLTRGRIEDQQLLFFGAGEAAIGCAELFVAALVARGTDAAAARRRCWLFDSKGLVVRRRDDLKAHKRLYAHDGEFIADLGEAVVALKPTALIGASGQPHTFDRRIVEAMARLNERPIIFSLSNPTSMSECTAEEAYTWSKGRAVFASGSPFDPVTLDGKRFVPGQGNNAYVFPGIGLGIVTCGIRHVTDAMFSAAAETLAGLVSQKELDEGCLFPPLPTIRDVSVRVAEAVAQVAYAHDLAAVPRPKDLRAHIRAAVFEPDYPSYV